MDKFFRVEVLSCTPNPQQVIWSAAHQDYSEDFVFDELHLDKEIWKDDPEKGWSPTGKFATEWDGPSEEECGDRIVKHLLSGHRGHYGPLEHPQIVFNCGWFPHSTMQQIRTHRVGISMDVQSGRYTGQRVADVALGRREVEEVFYLRPVGEYSDRQGKKYTYTEDERARDLDWCFQGSQRYWYKMSLGFSEEHARGLIPFDVRQHWILSCNLRSLIHILLIRGKRDAQLECQQLCELIMPHLQVWCPQVYEWFEKNLWLKGRLAP